jgi:hypothetical protein
MTDRDEKTRNVFAGVGWLAWVDGRYRKRFCSVFLFRRRLTAKRVGAAAPARPATRPVKGPGNGVE